MIGAPLEIVAVALDVITFLPTTQAWLYPLGLFAISFTLMATVM
jgi:hypothetical protein